MNDVERRLREDARDMTAQIERLELRRDNLLREADAIRRRRLVGATGSTSSDVRPTDA